MKTRNYIASPARSASSRSGIGPYAKLEHYAPPSSSQSHDRNSRLFVERKEAEQAQRKADRERRKAEKGLNWDLIRAILDKSPRLSLEQAKQIAEETGAL